MPSNSAQRHDSDLIRDAWSTDPQPADARGSRDLISVCPYCMERVLPSMTHCPRCMHEIEIASAPPSTPAATEGQSPRRTAPPSRTPAGGAALYALESPARCPHCDQEIRTFKVLRVLRTQVSFTSTLPRKGYIIVCPECERVMSAELSGLI